MTEHEFLLVVLTWWSFFLAGVVVGRLIGSFP